jgi:ArsR family transcriptional regulator
MEVNKKRYDELAKIFKSLASPIRIGMLILLAEKEHCACEFPCLLNISQPNSSRNLRVLRDAGLIKSYRDEQRIIYFIDDPAIKKFIESVQKLELK